MNLRASFLAGTSALALAALPACTTASSSSGADHASSSGTSHAAMTAEEAMAKMTEMAAPGRAHADLMAHAGNWTVDYEYRMGPDMPWQPMQGSIVSKPVLGGRFLMEEHAMEMMGIPMQGLLFLGFDNDAQEYTSLWMDSNSTWWVEARGTKSADGVTTLAGTMKDIAGVRPYRMKTWTKSDGAVQSEMYDTIAGQEVLVMKYTSHRKP